MSSRLHRWIWLVVALVGAAAIAAVLLAAVVPMSSDVLRKAIVSTLSTRLDSKVQLGGLRVRTFPRLHVEGDHLRIASVSDPGRPIIVVERFVADGDLVGLVRRHVGRVELVGLSITIPPDRSTNSSSTGEHRLSGGRPSKDDAVRDVVIDDLVSTDARLIILPSDARKPSKTWAIHRLLMHHVGIATTMPFDATLTNAVPPGEIHTTGRFGPWQPDDPGRTALEGVFAFDRADLSVFGGISGILSARGRFAGVLDRIAIEGDTDTPRFALTLSGHPVPLTASYRAVVDGTNGDTILERIDAAFLHSSLVARGAVVAVPGRDGRTVTLDVDMPHARLEDVLRLAMKTAKPTMTGGLGLKTKFVLPPGRADVADRLLLDGAFELDDAAFTDAVVQRKIGELSRRSRGEAAAAPKPFIDSDFAGRFTLRSGLLSFADLTFNTPGAAVRLAGRYALRAETLDFRGTLSMDAKVSETAHGFKRLLLKPLDPLFNRDGGGSRVPIRIGGTRSDPDFGLDARRVFAKKN